LSSFGFLPDALSILDQSSWASCAPHFGIVYFLKPAVPNR